MIKSIVIVLFLAICLNVNLGYSEPLLWPEPQILNYSVNSSDILITPGKLRLLVNIDGDFSKRIIHRYMEVFNFYERKIFVRESKTLLESEKEFSIELNILNETEMNLSSFEAYNLTVSENGASIKTRGFEGYLRALETFSQLIKRKYSDFKEFSYVIENAPIFISDWPSYNHRGLALDIGSMTASLQSLKNVLDGMMFNKMTHLHLQLLSSDGRAFESEGVLAETWDSLSNEVKSIYKELSAYAESRGVRIIAGVDVPADAAVLKNSMTEKHFTQLGMSDEQWEQCCLELPCALLDLNEESLGFTANFISKLSENLDLAEIHLGGRFPRIKPDCYSLPVVAEFFKSRGLQNISDYLGSFQNQLINRLTSKNILLLNDLTQRNAIKLDSRNVSDITFHTLFSTQVSDPYNHFPNSKYIITPSDRLLITDDEAGYINWKAVYYFEPRFYDGRGQRVDGGVFLLWDKKIQENMLESKLWVRASALGERLWNNKELAYVDISKVIERVFFLEKRLMDRGIQTSPATSEICGRSPNICWPQSRRQN